MIYRVAVVLDNGQRWAPLVAASTPQYAKARSLGMELGSGRVVKVESVTPAMAVIERALHRNGQARRAG